MFIAIAYRRGRTSDWPVHHILLSNPLKEARDRPCLAAGTPPPPGFRARVLAQCESRIILSNARRRARIRSRWRYPLPRRVTPRVTTLVPRVAPRGTERGKVISPYGGSLLAASGRMARRDISRLTMPSLESPRFFRAPKAQEFNAPIGSHQGRADPGRRSHQRQTHLGPTPEWGHKPPVALRRRVWNRCRGSWIDFTPRGRTATANDPIESHGRKKCFQVHFTWLCETPPKESSCRGSAGRTGQGGSPKARAHFPADDDLDANEALALHMRTASRVTGFCLGHLASPNLRKGSQKREMAQAGPYRALLKPKRYGRMEGCPGSAAGVIAGSVRA